MKQGRKKLKNKEKYLTENLYGKVLTYNVFIFYTNLFVPCEVHVHAISGGNFGGVGWGGGGNCPRPPPLVELSICRKFSFYRKFGNT